MLHACGGGWRGRGWGCMWKLIKFVNKRLSGSEGILWTKPGHTRPRFRFKTSQPPPPQIKVCPTGRRDHQNTSLSLTCLFLSWIGVHTSTDLVSVNFTFILSTGCPFLHHETVCKWAGVLTWFLGADFSVFVCEGVWGGAVEAAVDLACLSLLILPAREVPICVLMIYTMYSVYVQSPEKKRKNISTNI